MKQKVVVGMSGGVDSSVAALLLLEQGYEVIGVTLQLWQDENGEKNNDSSASPASDAEAVAGVLGIPHHVIDFRDTFRTSVVDYFVKEYLAGRTPNPCIACNRYIKWESLLKKAGELGAELIATGHYAGIRKLPGGRLALCHSRSAGKDQTYALYALTQEQLAHTLMPLYGYEKKAVRELAVERGLPVADKPDSQDICFVPDGRYADFIESRAGEKTPGPGNFVTTDGSLLGQHKGITHYTIGQRKGLGLAMGHPVFVSEIRPETDEVVIGEETDIFCRELTCSHINYMGMESLPGPRRVWAKIRYAHPGEWCTIEQAGEDCIRCIFEKPVRAITPGQAAVFYEEDYVLGGGIID